MDHEGRVVSVNVLYENNRMLIFSAAGGRVFARNGQVCTHTLGSCVTLSFFSLCGVRMCVCL